MKTAAANGAACKRPCYQAVSPLLNYLASLCLVLLLMAPPLLSARPTSAAKPGLHQLPTPRFIHTNSSDMPSHPLKGSNTKASAAASSTPLAHLCDSLPLGMTMRHADRYDAYIRCEAKGARMHVCPHCLTLEGGELHPYCQGNKRMFYDTVTAKCARYVPPHPWHSISWAQLPWHS
jgi:hypothetical protein